MARKHTSIKASEWPGGWFIVKQSIIDFFTNIVPWVVGLFTLVPIILAAVIQIAYHNSNSGSNVGLNATSAILGVVGVVALIYAFICWVVSVPLYGLARADGKKMTTKEVFTVRGNLLWRMIGAQLVLGLAIIIGFALLIIPGIILVIWLMPTLVLVPYVIIEEKLGVMDSIKKAHQLGKGHAGKVWGIVGWFFLIALIIFVPIAIAILAVISRGDHHAATTTTNSNSNRPSGSGGLGSGPISSISYAYLYRWIKKQPHSKRLTT